MKLNLSQIAGNRSILIFFLIFLLGFSLYSNILHGEFCSDDYIIVAKNSAIRDIRLIKNIWISFNTRFVGGLTFALNYYFGGLDVLGYHVINILIHCFNAFLLFYFVNLTFLAAERFHQYSSRERQFIALFASLVFLCHPIQTQAVSYITQRVVSLMAFFYLSALILYIRGRIAGKNALCFWALVPAALAMLTKEMAITLPLSLASFEFFFLTGSTERLKQRVARLIPFLLVSFMTPIALILDRCGSALRLKDQISGETFNWNFFLTEINVLRTYLRLLFFPVNQMHDYIYPVAQGLWEPRTFFSVCLVGILLSLIVVLFKKNRLMSFLILWFFISTSVEFGVVCFINFGGVMYEHWLYLPMVGFSFFLSLLLYTLLRREKSYKIVMVFLIAVFCFATYQRNKVWQNEIAFWKDLVMKSDDNNASAYFGLGAAYQRKGRVDEAIVNYRKALGIKPQYEEVYLNLGAAYYLKGEIGKAKEYFQKAIEIFPHYAKPYYNLGVILSEQGYLDEAIEYYRYAVELNPRYALAYDKLGLAYWLKGEQHRSEEYYLKAFEIDPSLLERYEKMGQK